MAEECKEQCEIGSLVVIRGRLQSNRYEKDDKVYYNYEIVGEKVTYES
ncbi:MAG: single-stranded DNA-binding protein [Solobacterium sp.]|nr:single-stranded DNA-binding protein [Solobacterium sp.]